MTTLKGALDRVHRYLQQLPENVANVGAQSLYDPRFQSEEWPRPVYPITRADLEAILNQAVPYERPSRFSGTPEQWDAWFREVLTDDKRLEFYQWIGQKVVEEIVTDIGVLGVPGTAEAAITVIERIGPRPATLPLGLPFCSVAHHAHPGGDGRLPTCRLDEESDR